MKLFCTCAVVFVAITSTSCGVLPRPRRVVDPHLIKYSDLTILSPPGTVHVKHNDKYQFENTMGRKRGLVPFFLKMKKRNKENPTILDLRPARPDKKTYIISLQNEHAISPADFVIQYLRNSKHKHHKDNSVNDLFDQDGVLYLTPRKNDEDRKINKLLNKVANYNLDLNQGNSLLRKPLTAMFDSEEVFKIGKIARAIDNDKRAEEALYNKKIVYEDLSQKDKGVPYYTVDTLSFSPKKSQVIYPANDNVISYKKNVTIYDDKEPISLIHKRDTPFKKVRIVYAANDDVSIPHKKVKKVHSDHEELTFPYKKRSVVLAVGKDNEERVLPLNKNYEFSDLVA